MRNPIAFHEKMMGDIMSLQQALKQPNAKEFVQAVIKEIHDQVDSDAGLLAPSQRYSTIEEGEVCGL
jgi:hypothetical protein